MIFSKLWIPIATFLAIFLPPLFGDVPFVTKSVPLSQNVTKGTSLLLTRSAPFSPEMQSHSCGYAPLGFRGL